MLFNKKKKKKNLGERIRDLFKSNSNHDQLLERLEELLIEADLGAQLTMELVDELNNTISKERIKDPEEVIASLKVMLQDILLEAHLNGPDNSCLLFLGVNGVGKTTSIAKYAHLQKKQLGKDRIILAAGDTFRAAATDQLGIHAERLGVRLISQGAGADPAAVIFDALESARSNNNALVLADTAGRMHNKNQLVAELEKIDRIITRKEMEKPYRKILVIDAGTGQNALQQAEVFHRAIGVDGIILSKYDSKAKGGIVVRIAKELKIPVYYLGTGESYDDLVEFNKVDFVNQIFDRPSEN